jgi:hypothetical protein
MTSALAKVSYVQIGALLHAGDGECLEAFSIKKVERGFFQGSSFSP